LSAGRTLVVAGRRVCAPGCAPGSDAVAIRDEQVALVGRRQEVRRAVGAGAEYLDCGSGTILPGLLDPHLHLLALAAREAHLDCSQYAGVDALLAGIHAHAASLPAGAWVRGEGLDDRHLGRWPTPDELDRAAGGRPVRLRHRSRHASLLGAEALRRLGFARGGARDGSRTGALESGREAEISRRIGPLPEVVLARGLARTGRELAACGITTVADATPRTRSGLKPLRTAVEKGWVPQRVYAMRRTAAVRLGEDEPLRPGPVKILLEEGPRGLRPSPLALARAVRGAAAAGAQVAVHCTSGAMLVAALAAFASLPRPLRAGRRHRLEHLGECPPSLVAAIADLELVVVTNPVFVRERGDVYRAETTPAAWSWLYRARSLAAAGVRLAGASDAPVGSCSPWLGIAAARTRRTRSGAPLGSGERLSARAALALFTTGAAFALHADTLGRLELGGPADLIVVEPDPLRAPADEIVETRVRLAMVGGRVVWAA